MLYTICQNNLHPSGQTFDIGDRIFFETRMAAASVQKDLNPTRGGV
jgi:hypothetical protein